MLDRHTRELLAAAFPNQPISEPLPTTGGYSHTTLRVRIGAERCVLKVATHPRKRADVRHEARVLAAIAPLGLPAPTPLACLEGEEATVLITRGLPGEHGIAQIAGAPDDLPHVYRTLGALAARIHASPLAPPDASFLLAARIEQAQQALPSLPLDPALRTVLLQSLAHPAWRAEPRLLHGDLGLHNVLWDGQRIALLDWEWASWGAPLLDLAWLAWTLRWRSLPKALWRAFLGGYGNQGGIEALIGHGTLRQLMLGQIAMILVRVHGNDAAFGEWVRRGEWTQQ